VSGVTTQQVIGSSDVAATALAVAAPVHAVPVEDALSNSKSTELFADEVDGCGHAFHSSLSSRAVSCLSAFFGFRRTRMRSAMVALCCVRWLLEWPRVRRYG